VLLARIRKRGRRVRAEFDPEYLAELARTYNDFFHGTTRRPCWSSYQASDFVESERDFEELIGQSGRSKAGTHYY